MKKFIQKVREYFSRAVLYGTIAPAAGGTGNFNFNGTPTGATVTLSLLETWIRSISTFLITIGVIIAAIFIIWGGIGFMLAGGNPEKATAAKTRLMNGIIGALIVLGVGLILRTIGALVTGGVFDK